MAQSVSDPSWAARIAGAITQQLCATGSALDVQALQHTIAEQLAPLLQTLERQQRLASLGALSGGILHDLRNPLSVMETSLFILRDRVGEDALAKKHIGRIAEQLATARALLTDGLDVVRDGPTHREIVDARSLVDRALALLVRPTSVQITVEQQGRRSSIECEPRQIVQVLLNLLRNAEEALSGRTGRLIVEILNDDVLGQVTIAVQDDGPGIAPALRAQLFEPLFTTKAEGTGLGLVVCRRIARSHGGDIVATFPPTGGSRFALSLPSVQKPT